ncbi:MAG: hypothetical protein ACYDHD_06265 [Vulcanimicrobiaceae bacterium]
MGNTRSVQFPESMTGVQVATMVQAELSERGIAVTMKSVSNGQLFLPRTGTLASGHLPERTRHQVTTAGGTE